MAKRVGKVPLERHWNGKACTEHSLDEGPETNAAQGWKERTGPSK